MKSPISKDKNFWVELKEKTAGKRPILALAPMAGITDSPFRQICKEFGADVVYSEMASATALVYNPAKTLDLLSSTKKEAPYVVQLFGSNPEHFTQAVKLLTDNSAVSKLQITNYKLPSGFDINFGCPVKKVAKQGAGAVLMDKPMLGREIVKAVLEATDLPVSIKIRTKSGNVTAHQFLDELNDLQVSAVMIHGRTMKQGHAGPVDVEAIKAAREYFGGVLLANGGVETAEQGMDLWKNTLSDGIGIGRGCLGRPWLFKQILKSKFEILNREQIFEIAMKHAKLVVKMKGEQGLVEMRKHLCWYVAGQPNAAELRRRLVASSTLKEIELILGEVV